MSDPSGEPSHDACARVAGADRDRGRLASLDVDELRIDLVAMLRPGLSFTELDRATAWLQVAVVDIATPVRPIPKPVPLPLGRLP